MMIRVKVFAAAKEIVGDGHVELELADGACVGDLKSALIDQIPKLKELIGRSAFALDQQYASDEDLIADSCEVALIPPVSGG